MRWHAPQLQRTAAQRGCWGGSSGAAAARAPALGQWLQPGQQLARDLSQLRLATGASPQAQQLETERIAEPGPASSAMAGAEQAAPAAAREQQPECRGGALSLAGPGGREQEVRFAHMWLIRVVSHNIVAHQRWHRRPFLASLPSASPGPSMH